MDVSLSSVGRWPCKSVPAASQSTALHFDELGLFGDREFMWVEADSGRFVSQRQDTVLASIFTSTTDGHLHFHTRDGSAGLNVHLHGPTEPTRPVSVWDWQGTAVDQGDAAADWGSELVGRKVRLVRVSRNHPRYPADDETLGVVGFADAYPLLVISTASVDEFNRWLIADGHPEIDVTRWRANLVIDDVEPFGEDMIDSLRLPGTDLLLQRTKACGRCAIPDTDQTTGKRTRNVRTTLSQYRQGRHTIPGAGPKPGLLFGQNFVVTRSSESSDIVELAAGETLKATIATESNWEAV